MSALFQVHKTFLNKCVTKACNSILIQLEYPYAVTYFRPKIAEVPALFLGDPHNGFTHAR